VHQLTASVVANAGLLYGRLVAGHGTKGLEELKVRYVV